MNYLAHAFLSFENPEILAGNMMGDFVKGLKILETFPEGIKKGMLLHRHIDTFTDAHPAVKRAKNYFRIDYGLYAGAFVDTLNDHFLANDPRCFNSEKELLQFTKNTYQILEGYAAFFPYPFARMFPYMREQNWLYNYRTLSGAKKSFMGVVKRSQYLESADKAYEIFISHYYVLNQCYYDLIDDLIIFAKNIVEGQ